MSSPTAPRAGSAIAAPAALATTAAARAPTARGPRRLAQSVALAVLLRAPAAWRAVAWPVAAWRAAASSVRLPTGNAQLAVARSLLRAPRAFGRGPLGFARRGRRTDGCRGAAS